MAMAKDDSVPGFVWSTATLDKDNQYKLTISNRNTIQYSLLLVLLLLLLLLLLLTVIIVTAHVHGSHDLGELYSINACSKRKG